MLKKIIQCKPVIPLVTSLLSSVVVTSAQALTVNLDSNGNVTSIKDLQVVETSVEIPGEEFLFTVTSTYDINFVYGSFDDIFGDPSGGNFDTSCDLEETGNRLCFWQNSPQANRVMEEINIAFNELNPIPSNVAGTPIGEASIFPPEFGVNINNFYYVPVDFNGVSVIARQARNEGSSWASQTQNFSLDSGNFDSYIGAELTAQQFQAEIPESSNIIGIIVTGLSIILLTKKK